MTKMLFPFTQLNNETKFAYAVSETFKAMQTSVQQGNPVLGSASDNFTITDFMQNKVSEDIYNFVHSDDCNYNKFIECIFALYNTFDLYKDPA